jgi:acetoin utilization deacetylase AcuC-like enzyme
VAKLFFCDHHEFPLPPGHKFPVRKYRLVRELLAADGFFQLAPAPLVPAEVLETAHDSEYVRSFLDGSLDAAVMRRIGFPWSEGLVRRTLASVGGTLAAAVEALEHGWSGSLAGGTHHADRSTGAGFCVFNDLAVAILDLRARGRLRKAAVIDLDVHQGDGTAAIFAEDPETLTFSIHGRNNFPFRKRRSVIDVDLEDGTGDEAYLAVLESWLPRVLDFAPDLVLYQAGVDGLETDRLGRLGLSIQGLTARDCAVAGICHARRAPLAITLGGGYSEPVERTAEAHANTFRAAAAVFG